MFLKLENRELDLRLVLEWGFDGSQTKCYKMKFAKEDSHDNHIMCSSIVPLRLIDKNSGNVYWDNQDPSSVTLCTCFHMQYAKEEKELCLAEKEYVESQIESLQPMKVFGSIV